MKLPSINTDLLLFKIHYFLKYGGESFLPFAAPLAIQRGIPPKGVGLIWTLNPLVSTVFSVMCGTLADKRKLHRMLLLATCALLLASFTAFFFLPSVPEGSQPTIRASGLIECVQNNSVLIICPSAAKFNVFSGVTFPPCRSNYSDLQSDTSEKCELICNYVSLTTEHFKFDYNSQYLCGERKCFSLTQNDTSFLFSNCSTELDLNCETVCRRSQKNTLADCLKTFAFWSNALCIMLMYMGVIASTSLVDSMCFVALGPNHNKFGQQRMFGALGLGIMGPMMGVLVNLFSKDQPETNYTPAMIITTSLLFLNLAFTTRINVKVPGKQARGDVRNALISFSCILLMSTALIMGTVMGMLWAFEFIYIREVSLLWNPNFSETSLLQGIIIFTDCFIGELPFLFLSGAIIRTLNNINTFSMILIVTSVRLLLMSFIINPWIFVAVHLLHGISFGVFIPNITSSTNYLAPQGAQAIMQSVTMGCFTMGTSVGALTGGLLMESVGGSVTFLTMGLTISLYTVIYIFINWCVIRMKKKASRDENLVKIKKTANDENHQKIDCKDSESIEKESMIKLEVSSFQESQNDCV